MAKVPIDKMSDEIVRLMSEYSADVTEATKRAVNETSAEAVKDLKRTSPRRESTGGAYAKSWTRKKTEETKTGLGNVIYNKQHYRLTHLLEFGHANARGGGRTPAHPHIGSAEARANDLLSEKTKEYINDIS